MTLYQNYQNIKKEFNKKFPDANYGWENYDDIPKDYALPPKEVLSFLHSALTRQLEEIEKIVEGMKKSDMVFKRKLEEGGGHPDFKAIEYNKAIQDLLSTLQQEKAKLEDNQTKQ